MIEPIGGNEMPKSFAQQIEDDENKLTSSPRLKPGGGSQERFALAAWMSKPAPFFRV